MAVIEFVLLAASFSMNIFIFWQNIDHVIDQVIRFIHDNEFEWDNFNRLLRNFHCYRVGNAYVMLLLMHGLCYVYSLACLSDYGICF